MWKLKTCLQAGGDPPTINMSSNKPKIQLINKLKKLKNIQKEVSYEKCRY